SPVAAAARATLELWRMSGMHGFAQKMLEHLSRRIARQRVDEANLSRQLVAGKTRRGELLELGQGERSIGAQHHHRYDALAPCVIRSPDDGDLCNGRVLIQNTLDFGQVYVFPAA